MREWNELLKYIDEYKYDEEEEQIVIRYSEKAREVQSEYDKALALAGEGKDAKWIFDIAVDCVRRMSDEDKEYIKKNMNTTEYHMGYAMGIRNRYIHPAKKHRVLIADHISSCVMKRIFSIVSPVYDYRNSRCVSFFENFDVQRLINKYGDSHGEIIEKFVEEVTSGDEENDKNDDAKRLKMKLRGEIGQEEFIKIFKEAYEYFNENEKQNKREDWYWNTNFPAEKAVLYPLESKQVRALRQFNYFWYIEGGSAKSLEECRKFIDENLGLRDDYADFMARCGWEACSPYYNGTWTELSLYMLDLDYGIRSKLDKEIKTIGELCKKSRDELIAIQGITEIEAIKIENALLEWLNERKLVRIK